MGVWIETNNSKPNRNEYIVTPCVGVWIETLRKRDVLISATSHPAWVCGLKLDKFVEGLESDYVTPCVGVWIET